MVRPFEELLNLGGVAVEEAPIEQQQPSPDPVQRVGAKSFEEIMAEGRMQEDGERQQAQQISLSQPDYPEDKIDFFENIKRGGWGGFFDKATLGVKPLVEAASLYGATKRLRANDYGEDVSAIRARRADQEQIIDYLEDQAEVQSRGLTVAATVGTVVGEMLPFVVEFIATGGLAAIGKKAVTKSVLKLATKIAGKEAAKQAGKFTARQATAKLAGWATAAGVRTALTPHRVLKGYIDNRMPDIQFSPEGQIILKESKNSPFTAAYKAIASQWVEMASEEAGAAIGKAVGFAGKKVLPASAVAAMNRLRDAWVGAKGGRKITDFVKKISSITGKGSMLEEMGEERLGALMRIPLGIDESGKDTTFEKIGNALYPGARQLWIEAIAFSVPAGGQLAISKALGGGEKKTFSRKDVKDLFGIDKPTSAAERKQIFDDYQAVRNQELSLPPPATGAVGTEAAAPAIEQAEGIVQPTQAPSMGLAAPKEGVSPGEGAITPKPTQAKPEAVGEIGKPFSEQVEDLKVLHKKGEITTRELGARISAIKTEPITEVVKSSKLTGINKLLDDFEEGIIETAEDLVDEVDAISEDAPQLQEAVNRFRADAREDLEVFGDRGDSDAREEAFIAAIKQARPAKPEGKVVKSKGLIEKPVAEAKPEALTEVDRLTEERKLLAKQPRTAQNKKELASLKRKIGIATRLEASGMTDRQRGQLLKEAEKEARKTPAFDAHEGKLSAYGAEVSPISESTVYIDPKYRGEVESYFGEFNKRGSIKALWNKITFRAIEAEGWDVQAMERAGRDPSFEGATLDDYLQAMLDDYKARKEGAGAVPEVVLNELSKSQDWQEVALASRISMLQSGLYSKQDIADTVEEIRREFEDDTIDETTDIEKEFEDDEEIRTIREAAEAAEEELAQERAAKPEREKDLLGRPVLQGGAAGKQTEFLDKEKFKTEQARQAEESKRLDIKGQKILGLKPATEKAKPKPKSKGLKAQYGKKNIVVSEDQYKKDIKKLTDPTKLSLGADPSMLAVVTRIGVYHLEASGRSFTEWSAKMVRDIGERIKPHLQSIWNNITEGREQQPEKSKGLIEKPKPVAVKAEAPKPAEKVVKSKSVVANEVAAYLGAENIAFNLEHDVMSIKENARAAQAYVKSNTNEAVQIAQGGKNDTGITTSAIIASLVFQAKANKNFDEMQKFAKQLFDHNLQAGREGAANRAFTDESTVLQFHAMLQKNLIDAKFKPKTDGKVVTSAAKVAEEAVKKRVSKARKKMSTAQMNISNAQKFIESLRCK